MTWTLPAAGTDLAGEPINMIRVRPGVSYQQLDRAMQVLAGRIALETHESTRDNRVWVSGAGARGQFHMSRFHLALIGAVLAVLGMGPVDAGYAVRTAAGRRTIPAAGECRVGLRTVHDP